MDRLQIPFLSEVAKQPHTLVDDSAENVFGILRIRILNDLTKLVKLPELPILISDWIKLSVPTELHGKRLGVIVVWNRRMCPWSSFVQLSCPDSTRR